MNYEELLPKIKVLAFEYGVKALMAILVLFIGLKVIKVIVNSFKKILVKKSVAEELISFLSSILDVILKVSLFISVTNMVGIETTSFVAVLGAAGLAVGLALQGTLANFAGGTLIILLKPFKIGDYIDAQGESGTVKDIQIFNTILNTPDNKRIILPNGPLANGNITNYSTEAFRRVDFVFGIGYDDDLKKAKEILVNIQENDPRVIKDMANQVVVGELADSSVNFIVRSFVKSADYWDVKFETIEKVKLTFDQEGISIPFPQRDIHVYNK